MTLEKPDSLDEIYGHEDQVRYLQKAIDEGNLKSHMIFRGPHGVGKSAIARLVADQFGMVSPTVELGDGNHRKNADTLRSLLDTSSPGSQTIVVAEELDYLTPKQQKKVEKKIENLEFGSGKVPRIIFTTNVEEGDSKIRSKIWSVCTTLSFDELPECQMRKYVAHIAKKRNLNLSERDITQIVQDADGKPREALNHKNTLY